MKVWDIGGQTAIRQLWVCVSANCIVPSYYHKTVRDITCATQSAWSLSSILQIPHDLRKHGLSCLDFWSIQRWSKFPLQCWQTSKIWFKARLFMYCSFFAFAAHMFSVNTASSAIDVKAQLKLDHLSNPSAIFATDAVTGTVSCSPVL